uniref:Plasmid stabilization protein n=1 Tax=uncultured Thiotrichaceae bacterium TaxID=298394 RepID=A0A6S6SYU6_9GAMM|nr:MAG: Plasmid stabilization protein [uncultured Thiotrichaceae bacterium]
MSHYRVLKAAGYRIDEIYLYTLKMWGEKQAKAYINGMFERFQAIADKDILWQPIPAEFGVSGYFTRYGKHHIYWKELADGDVGIASVLHQSMDKENRLREDTFEGGRT